MYLKSYESELSEIKCKCHVKRSWKKKNKKKKKITKGNNEKWKLIEHQKELLWKERVLVLRKEVIFKKKI